MHGDRRKLEHAECCCMRLPTLLLTAQIRTLQRRLYEVEHRADAGSSAAVEGEDGDDSDALYAAGEVPRLLAHSRRAAAEMERYGQVSRDVLH